MSIKTAISKRGDRVYTDGFRFIIFDGGPVDPVVPPNFDRFMSVPPALVGMAGYNDITDWEDV